MFLPFLLLAVSIPGDSSLAELARENFRVQPHDYRFIEAKIGNWPATLICAASVTHGAGVRLELLTHNELFEFVRGRRHQALLSMDEGKDREFSQALPDKGQYAIVLVNDENEPSEVRLDAEVQFAREPDVAKYLSPGKRLTVILLSLFVFFTTVSWSAWKLVGAMRRV